MTKLPSQYKYKKQVVGLISLCAFAAFVYLGLFASTVNNALMKQRAEAEIKMTTAHLSEIEFAYLEKKATVSASLARELGFVEPEEVVIARSVARQTALRQ